MDFGVLLLDLIITVFFYLLVPIIFCLHRKPLTAAQIKKIVIINGVVVWLLCSIISEEFDKWAPAVLWSGFAHWLLKRNCLIDGETEEPSGADENNSPQEEQTIRSETPPKKAERFCSKCGGLIDANTKQCTKCGKQYFNGFDYKSIALIVLSVLLVISLIFNVIQAKETKSFYEENAVCVSDINDDYHKYGCWAFDDSEYWIFNTEYAEYLGYEPCPYCCE